MYHSSITSKGQITIPIDIREKMHLQTGDRITFIIKDDSIKLVPLNKSLAELRGILPKPKKALSCEEMNQIIKDKYDRD